MAKPKKKLTAAQRTAKKQRKKDFMTVFMNGRQVRVRRPPNIDGVPVEQFIRQNADPIWCHQNGYHELLEDQSMEGEQGTAGDATDDFDFINPSDEGLRVRKESLQGSQREGLRVWNHIHPA